MRIALYYAPAITDALAGAVNTKKAGGAGDSVGAPAGLRWLGWRGFIRCWRVPPRCQGGGHGAMVGVGLLCSGRALRQQQAAQEQEQDE